MMAPPKRRWLFPIALLSALFLAGACAPSDDAALAEKAERVFGRLPDAMPGSEDDTAAMVALGRALFTTTELSKTRTQSCESCHRLDAAGVDRLVRSPGAMGGEGTRNTPTVFNAGLHTAPVLGRSRENPRGTGLGTDPQPGRDGDDSKLQPRGAT